MKSFLKGRFTLDQLPQSFKGILITVRLKSPNISKDILFDFNLENSTVDLSLNRSTASGQFVGV